MSYFVEASKKWAEKQKIFIKENLVQEKSSIAERIQILLTVPKGTEHVFKDLAKLKRAEADIAIKLETPDERSLALLFEKNNPPPKRSDYE